MYSAEEFKNNLETLRMLEGFLGDAEDDRELVERIFKASGRCLSDESTSNAQAQALIATYAHLAKTAVSPDVQVKALRGLNLARAFGHLKDPNIFVEVYRHVALQGVKNSRSADMRGKVITYLRYMEESAPSHLLEIYHIESRLPDGTRKADLREAAIDGIFCASGGGESFPLVSRNACHELYAAEIRLSDYCNVITRTAVEILVSSYKDKNAEIESNLVKNMYDCDLLSVSPGDSWTRLRLLKLLSEKQTVLIDAQQKPEVSISEWLKCYDAEVAIDPVDHRTRETIVKAVSALAFQNEPYLRGLGTRQFNKLASTLETFFQRECDLREYGSSLIRSWVVDTLAVMYQARPLAEALEVFIRLYKKEVGLGEYSNKTVREKIGLSLPRVAAEVSPVIYAEFYADQSKFSEEGEGEGARSGTLTLLAKSDFGGLSATQHQKVVDVVLGRLAEGVKEEEGAKLLEIYTKLLENGPKLRQEDPAFQDDLRTQLQQRVPAALSGGPG